MSDKEFPQGIQVKAPHEKSPEFVKGQISIRVAEFQDWLSKQPNEWVNLDIKVSKGGTWYVDLNNWKPDASKQKHDKAKADGYAPARKEFVDDDINDIPF